MFDNKKPLNPRLDPLYIIFEQHLCNFQDPSEDRKTFVSKVVGDYLTFLRKNRIAVPPALEGQVAEELGDMVNAMLVKKIYGCLNLEEFQRSLTPDIRKGAGRRYKRLRSKTG
ncbi:MAG TPA: hypothetical protein VL588_00440 [Bdellovibrionota bacterium]|jgi:hypothetical protein|nr:hypothetical protein [Bdellovibrionota bacterium]